MVVRRAFAAEKARRIGWRVGHVGLHAMYYEELVGGRWERIDIDGEILAGPAHHIIYFASEAEWTNYPVWARDRRAEIVGRIKAAFAPLDYEHHDR